MIRLKVKEILLASGKQYPATWLVKHCGMTVPKAYKILNGKQKSLNFKDISKLCEKLNCTPNDLFYWENTGHSKVPDNHPLIEALKTPDKYSNWFDIFKRLSADKVVELHSKAGEMVEGK